MEDGGWEGEWVGGYLEVVDGGRSGGESGSQVFIR